MNNLLLIAGPCVIENRDLVMGIAEEMKKATDGLPIDYVFKASFDKANRTSSSGFRGPGMEEGLKILSELRDAFDIPILTDVHLPHQCGAVAEVVDYLQVPAFLCRQTDLLLAAAQAASKNNRIVNVKKGQFLAPWDISGMWCLVNVMASCLSFTATFTTFGSWYSCK